MLSKMYRTALRDKFTAHNRVIEPQPIAKRSGDTLNRIGRNRAGPHREHAHTEVPLSKTGAAEPKTRVTVIFTRTMPH